jgi:hypothetical protein
MFEADGAAEGATNCFLPHAQGSGYRWRQLTTGSTRQDVNAATVVECARFTLVTGSARSSLDVVLASEAYSDTLYTPSTNAGRMKKYLAVSHATGSLAPPLLLCFFH